MRRKSGKIIRWLKDGIIAALLLVAGTLVAARVDGIHQQTFSGRFSVVDGDTIARDGERFRLMGIDAPELSQSCSREGNDWPCGRQAKTYVQTLLQSGDLDCEGSSRDRYKRLLVRCHIGERDLAGEIVAAGYAVTTEYFLFSHEQTLAKSRGLGIWSGAFEMPADWRKERKAADMDVPLAGVLTLLRHILGW